MSRPIFKQVHVNNDTVCVCVYMYMKRLWRILYTLCGAGSREILALVIIPNCPKPPRTA